MTEKFEISPFAGVEINQNTEGNPTVDEQFYLRLGVPLDDARRIVAGRGPALNAQIESRLKKIHPSK